MALGRCVGCATASATPAVGACAMTIFKCSLLRVYFVVLASVGVSGCWAAKPWAHDGLVVDVARANASKSGVADATRSFLISHGLSYAGKAGYDSTNGTRTVVDFNGPDDLIVSIQLDRDGAVFIYFNQDRPSFTPQARKFFDALENDLKKQWPGAVTREKSPKSNDQTTLS